jgi:hypothetical protein
MIYALYTSYRNTKILSDALLQVKVLEKMEAPEAKDFIAQDLDIQKKINKSIAKSEMTEMQKLLKKSREAVIEKDEWDWVEGVRI